MYKQTILILVIDFEIFVFLKSNHLNKGIITPASIVKSKILDFLEKLENEKKALSYLEMCYEIFELFRPYCYKVDIRTNEYKATYEN